MKTYTKNKQFLYDIDDRKEITRGGEGQIIDISTDKVAKIYLPNIKPITEVKFKELFELKLNMFIKPEELLYNDKGKIIGFTMIKVPSNFFPLISIFNIAFCNREGITDNIKLLILERVVEGLKFAHNKNIIIGDLNPYNILVNDKGLVYFLDVDSYETTTIKHSGILLDDIRDYLFNGTVSINSDYFALGVLSFNCLTNVHPFKGVCKNMPSISERMIHKKSILNSNDVIIPKCYKPINEKFILEQYERMFNNGERFIINLKNTNIITHKIIKKPLPTVIKTNDLMIHILYSDNVIMSYASKTRLVLINDKNQMIVYDVSLKGTFKQIMIKSNINPKNKLFIHKECIYSIIDNKLVDILTNDIIMTFNTIQLKCDIYNNILVVVTPDSMYKFDLNSKYGNKISFTTTDTFGGRFNNLYSLYQNISGNTLLFYEKNGLNSAILKNKIKNLHQRDNISIIEMIENENVSYKLLNIKNLQITTYDCQYDSLRMFDKLNDNVIVVPEDDKLLFINTENMQEIIGYHSNEIYKDSVIHCTNGGIVVVNNDSVYFMNKK